MHMNTDDASCVRVTTRALSRHRGASAVAGLGVVLLLCATSCRQAGYPNDTLHPTAANIVSDDAIRASITRMDDANAPTALRRTASSLRSLAVRLTIGTADGEPTQVFSRIVDATVNVVGEILVLDKSLGTVRVFDEGGTFVTEFSGADQSRLASPDAIESASNTDVIVADRSVSHQRIKMFARDGASYRLVRTIPVDLTPEDVCVMGDYLYVRGVEPQKLDSPLVHKYSLRGPYVASFGAAYTSHNQIVRVQMSKGRIACSPDAGVIIAVSERLPFIHGYAPDGKLLWVSKIADFLSPRIVEGVDDKGSYFNISRRRAFDFPAGVVPLTDGQVLIQVARVHPGGQDSELHSYVLDSRTGVALYVGPSLPRVIAVRWPRLFGVETKPYAKLVEHKLASSGRALGATDSHRDGVSGHVRRGLAPWARVAERPLGRAQGGLHARDRADSRPAARADLHRIVNVRPF